MDVVAAAEVPGEVVERVRDVLVVEMGPLAYGRLVGHAADTEPRGRARDHGGERNNREIAVPARNLAERIAGAALRLRIARGDHHLVRLLGSGQQTELE